MLGTEIDDEVANVIVAQLLFLESEDPTKDITVYVNSAGGSVTAALAIIETMQSLKPTVGTVCIGQACGMAALLLACGARGQRSAMPNARILLLRTSEGAQTPVDPKTVLREVQRLNEKLVELYMRATRQPPEKIVADLERERGFDADEAVAYGLIDSVVRKPSETSTG